MFTTTAVAHHRLRLPLPTAKTTATATATANATAATATTAARYRLSSHCPLSPWPSAHMFGTVAVVYHRRRRPPPATTTAARRLPQPPPTNIATDATTAAVGRGRRFTRPPTSNCRPPSHRHLTTNISDAS